MFSRYHYEESVWVNISIMLILLSFSFISSLKLNSATVLKTKVGSWFCCTNDPFCSAISVIRLLQGQFCSLDRWIGWEASSFCSRWISIFSQFRSQSSCHRAKPEDTATVLPGTAAWCQGPRLPHTPLPLSHTREIPLCLRKPLEHPQIPTLPLRKY